MPVVEARVDLLVDGESVLGAPFYRRLDVSDADTFSFAKLNTSVFSAIPAAVEIVSAAILFVRPGATMDVRINGAAGSEVSIRQGGFMLVFDGTIVGTTVRNLSGATATLKGLSAGA